MRRFFAVLCIVGLPTLTWAKAFHAAGGPAYDFELFELPGAAYAIPVRLSNNKKPYVVGYGRFDGREKGFRLSLKTGKVKLLAFPGACATFASGVNSRGQVVGTYYVGTCDFPGGAEQHAFFRDTKGNYYTIDIPGAFLTGPEGVDDDGTVVGSALIGGAQQGYQMSCRKVKKIFSCGALTIYLVPTGVGTFQTRASDITAGRVAGEYNDHPESSRQHGYLWQNGVFTAVDCVGALGTSASGVSATLVSGFSYTADLASHGFLWEGNECIAVEPEGSIVSDVLDVNNSGVIIEVAEGLDRVPHWYIGFPQ